jgi:hypothetical protein
MKMFEGLSLLALNQIAHVADVAAADAAACYAAGAAFARAADAPARRKVGN